MLSAALAEGMQYAALSFIVASLTLRRWAELSGVL
jgi:hypothetical protein